LNLINKYTFRSFFIFGLFTIISIPAFAFPALFTQPPDTSDLPFQIPKDEEQYSSPGKGIVSPLFLSKPSNYEETIVFDPGTNSYIISEKVGSINYRRPRYMSIDEYQQYQFERAKSDYWREKSQTAEGDAQQSFIPSFNIGGEAFDKIFGTNSINIVPQGSAEVILGYKVNRTDNPIIAERFRKTGTLVFEQKIQMNVTGTIGDKMELGINYDTDATFDFENKAKIEYSGDEDEIIKKIEAGNVTLPLSGSLITGSQSLFGLKTEMQFGNLTVTNVFSHQRGESQVINVEGGAQLTDFEIEVQDYEEDKHYFLGHYFRENYEENARKLQTGAPIPNVRIEKIEVWITNRQGNIQDARNILAMTDLGTYHEDFLQSNAVAVPGNPAFPNNFANNLYQTITAEDSIRSFNQLASIMSTQFGQFNNGVDYEIIENARLLTEREYSVNRDLGFISLNFSLQPDQVLAVAYTLSANGEQIEVGERSNASGIAAPKTLVLKMLKSSRKSPGFANWDLMMKNVYSLGAYSVNREDFIFNIQYRDPTTGSPTSFIEIETDDGIKKANLLKIMGLDRINQQGYSSADGMFDFKEGITINSRNGRIYFPSPEPFGNYLKDTLGNNTQLINRYVFQELYDSTKTRARQIAEKNKFLFKGTYKSAVGSEIQLNALNIPQGSVKVTSGGILLQEGTDYTVDYTLGRVKILNEGLLESGAPLKVSLESNSLFNFQTKTFLGTNLNYRINDNFNVGATVIHLSEKPLTQKVSIGDEPVSNTIWGLNASYRTESPFLTSMVDKLPLLETKETSVFDISAEFAHLIPGQPKIIGRNGIAYIDDFEGSETSIDLKSRIAWNLASTPQHQSQTFFPAGDASTGNLMSGFNRAKLSWYHISEDFYAENDDITDHRIRRIDIDEVFPGKDLTGQELGNYIQTLNLSFYPKERGPYNFVTEGTVNEQNDSIYGLTNEGLLDKPETRWGGMMRDLNTTDFEQSNIEYFEFWLMFPGKDERPQNEEPYLVINIGDISEDVLRDGRKSFENGMPEDGDVSELDETNWARVPQSQSFVDNFSNDPQARKFQDVGLDGLNDEDEADYYEGYIDFIQEHVTANPDNREAIVADPAGDNFRYYIDSYWDENEADIIERYKEFAHVDNNSPVPESGTAFSKVNYSYPDNEDINDDYTLSQNEAYFQYRIPLSPALLESGHPYVVDSIRVEPNGDDVETDVTWYQFKVPIGDYDQAINGIEDFTSIKFMRMMLQGFRQEATLRFATFEMVRSEWRKYQLDLRSGSGGIVTPTLGTDFDVASINIEENQQRYALPPGIDRTIDPYNPQLQQDNEQSMVLRVQNLEDHDSRAAYKNMSLDMRNYKNLKMEVHAEPLPNGDILNENDLSVFIRLGSDYTDNYYEYEIPLKVSRLNRELNEGENESATIRELLWPEENKINIALNDLTDLKLKRNRQEVSNPLYVSRDREYSSYLNRGKTSRGVQRPPARVTIKGNPTLSEVRTLMIGVRNPGESIVWEDYEIPNESLGIEPDIDTVVLWNNDGMLKSGEIWVNELRLTDFNNEGGWAATTRIQTQLADFATVSIAGNTSTPGFGSVDQSVEERQKEEIQQYDIAANFELGKFFPEKAKVSIPMHTTFSERFVTPEFFPLDPDIEYDEAIENSNDPELAKEITRDYTKRKSLNFTNIRVNQRFDKFSVISPANFSLSTGYSENYRSNINYTRQRSLKYRAAFNYNYTIRTQPIRPFGNVNALNSPYFRIIRDINFNYLPSRVSFQTDMNRSYSELMLRNLQFELDRLKGLVDEDDNESELNTTREFIWNRVYAFNWDITRNIKMDYSATNVSWIREIDENNVEVEGDLFADPNDEWKKQVRESILDGGMNSNFSQNIGLSYNVPINKFPWFDWISLNSKYSAQFNWQREIPDNYGNTITNNGSLNINNQLNMQNLYRKVGYLRQLDRRRPSNEEKEYKTVTYDRLTFFRANVPKRIRHKLESTDLKVTVYDENDNIAESSFEIDDENTVYVTTPVDVPGATIVVEGQVEKGPNPFTFMLENTARLATGFKRFSLSYRRSGGSNFQHFMPETKFFGFNANENYAPGPYYVFALNSLNDVKGAQDEFQNVFDEHEWLYANRTGNLRENFQNPYSISASQNFNLRADYEPFNWIKIDLTAEHNHSENLSSANFYGDFDGDGSMDDDFEFIEPILGGNYTMTVLSIETAFENFNSNDITKSDAFALFEENRSVISHRIAEEYAENAPSGYNRFRRTGQYIDENDSLSVYDGYAIGFGPTSQQVLISSFLSSYTHYEASNVPTDPLPALFEGGYVPMPNWMVTFSGLNRIPFVKENFKSVNLSHGYRSRYSVNAYQSNQRFYADSLNTNQSGDLISPYEIAAVSINEQFSPLINLNITFKNNLNTKFEITTSRSLSLSLVNSTITEARDENYVIGIGYRFENLPIEINNQGYESDLNLTADFNYRNSRTLLRKVSEVEGDQDSEIPQGDRNIGFSLAADYAFSQSVNTRAYFRIDDTRPYISTSYPRRITEFGVSVQFTLTQ
jgi:cell surface protein SprA